MTPSTQMNQRGDWVGHARCALHDHGGDQQVGKNQGNKKRQTASLAVARIEYIPIPEVSGICFRRGPRGIRQVVAIGDRAALVAWGTVGDEPGRPIRWKTVDLRGFQGSSLPKKDPQIEAVCADGGGRLLLLQEFPSRVEFVDPQARRVLAAIDLVIADDHPLAEAWQDDEGSHGEGAVLLANGHLLIAKEKDPAALLEFGPAGAPASGFRVGRRRFSSMLAAGSRWPVMSGEQVFSLLAEWAPQKDLQRTCRDFSDLEVGPDGRLYLLSDESATIARLADLDPDAGKACAERVWELPRLKGKPEGLAFTRGGHALVALDRRRPQRNLVVLEPPIASPPRENKGETKGPTLPGRS
jgi:hypothetical protein